MLDQEDEMQGTQLTLFEFLCALLGLAIGGLIGLAYTAIKWFVHLRIS